MDDGIELDQNRIGVVASINVSDGGVPKRRVAGVQVFRSGLQHDAQRNRKIHGGPDRAVCLYSLERIHGLQREGHPIDIGTAGENVTIEGLDWGLMAPGVKARLGKEVLLEITSFTNPCKT